jgi:choice-of-anchor B domain-containing protein
MPHLAVVRPLRLAALALALACVPVTAAHAGHPPDQHDAQFLPASALGTFNVEAKMRATISAECEDGRAGPYPCKDVDLASFVPLGSLGGATGNDIWGWTDPETNREYAIMGTSSSTGFVDVTDPKDPVLVGVLPTRGTPDMVLWRDVKVHDDHAFIVAEVSGAGMQVFDLTRLRGRTSPTIFDADAEYDEVSNSHNISINTASDTAYLVGTNTCGNGDEDGGLHMVDVSTPTAPRFAGCAVVKDAGREPQSNNYVHDVECVIYDGPDRDHTGREICFGSNENAVVIYDVTDRKNPRVLSQTTYDTAAYTHQGSLTPDRRYSIFGDEIDEQDFGLKTTTYILDVDDLDAPPEPKAFTHETASIDHNLYVHGNRVFQSNYAAGLRILGYDNASLAAGRLNEVGFFDVAPEVDVAQYAGTWSNYRFPRSGNVVVSAIENEVSGLFVLTPKGAARPSFASTGSSGGGESAGSGSPGSSTPATASRATAPSTAATAPCATAAAFRSADVRPRGRRVRMAFSRGARRPVQVDVFQSSIGRRVIGERLVARYTGRSSSFTWNGRANREGRKVTDGYYFVRFRMRNANGRLDVRRDTLRRVKGRWSERRAFHRRDSCGLIRTAKLTRPVFGGRTQRAVFASYRLDASARVTVDVMRGSRLVRRYTTRSRDANRTYRVRFDAEGRPRGDYRFRISAVRDGKRTTRVLVTRRL